VKTGIQNLQRKDWIPAGVHPDENRGRNDEKRGCPKGGTSSGRRPG